MTTVRLVAAAGARTKGGKGGEASAIMLKVSIGHQILKRMETQHQLDTGREQQFGKFMQLALCCPHAVTACSAMLTSIQLKVDKEGVSSLEELTSENKMLQSQCKCDLQILSFQVVTLTS